MAKDSKQENPAEGQEFVPVVFARSDDEAEEYRQLLEDHEIDVAVGFEELDERGECVAETTRNRRGVPVLVPEIYLDEASEIISERDDLEDEFELDGNEDETEDEEDEDDFSLELDEEEEIFEEEEEDDFVTGLDEEYEEDEDLGDEDDYL